MKKRLLVLLSIIICVSLLIICNKNYKKNNYLENWNEETKKVKIVYDKLYSYIGNESKQDGIESFSSIELMEIALDNIEKKDLIETEEVTKDNEKIYLLSNETIDNKLKKIFNKSKIIDKESIIEKHSFYINKNTNDDNYSGIYIDSYTDEGLKFIFSKSKDGKELLKNMNNRKIVSIYQNHDKWIVKEKIIYYEIKLVGKSKRKINIYNTTEKERKPIDEIIVKKEELNNTKINIDNYINKAATIISEYQKEGNKYYFIKSEIKQTKRDN